MKSSGVIHLFALLHALVVLVCQWVGVDDALTLTIFTMTMTVIQKKFEDNTSYSNPIHAVNQADSIAALSVDLYTDSNRFIYELLPVPFSP